MKFLHVIDPIERFDITKDTSFVFLSEAQKRGHENYACSISGLSAGTDGVAAYAASLKVKPVQGEHYAYGKFARVAAAEFDAVALG